MSERLYESMNLYDSCKIDSTIFKKYFYESVNITKSDKDILKDDVDKVVLKYSLKEENVNVPAYKDDNIDYDEIEIIEVNLITDKRYKKVYELIQKAIPYPLIIVLRLKENIMINTAFKRINKNDEEKDIIEKFVNSEWIDVNRITGNEELFLKSIDIKNLSFANMYKLYRSFVDKIEVLNACKYQGNFKDLICKDNEKISKISDEINSIDDEITRLRVLIRNEVQFNKRMDMNIEIRKLQTKKSRLINELNS